MSRIFYPATVKNLLGLPVRHMSQNLSLSHLAPSLEAMEKLQRVDFGSPFSDSGEPGSQDQNASDDPFDSQDLIGIIREEVLSQPARSPMKVEEQLPPKVPIMAPEPPSVYSTPLSSPLRQKTLLGILGGTVVAPPKRIKLDMPDRRHYSTNSTIQLATQKPLLQANPDSITSTGVTTSEVKVVKPIILSAEQEYVLSLAKEGRSLFFTGSAGTGKSVLLRSIIRELRKLNTNGFVAVTASTGLAACNVGGNTLHSFAGIGLGSGEAEDLLKMVRKNRKAKQRWLDCRALIIDEISMIDGRLFTKLDYIARNIRRKKHLPFGGIQVIVCGDFYQLPPVSKNEIKNDGTEIRDEAVFAFECEAWKNVIQSQIILKEVFRQKGDQEFIDLLNDMRKGIVSSQAEREFARLSRPLDCPAGVVPTELYATRNEVDYANSLRLHRLEGQAMVFEAKDSGTLPPHVLQKVLANFLAPKKLFLKKSAQVMCIKNYDDQLVNGSLGQVIDFVYRDVYMCEQVMHEDPNSTFEQFQKSLLQKKIRTDFGDKVDDAKVEQIIEEMSQADRLFQLEKMAQGNGYTLLDSVFNFFSDDNKDVAEKESVVIKKEASSVGLQSSPYKLSSSWIEKRQPDLLEQAFEENKQRKIDFLIKMKELISGERHPLVRFLNPDGVTTRDVMVEPEVWEIEDDKTHEILARRVQYPLMLAWALSVHKSQGQTLQKVKVDLSRIFENGQAYVALSRAVSREGLQVFNFSKHRVKTNKAVEEFYESLSTTEDLARLDQ